MRIGITPPKKAKNTSIFFSIMEENLHFPMVYVKCGLWEVRERINNALYFNQQNIMYMKEKENYR